MGRVVRSEELLPVDSPLGVHPVCCGGQQHCSGVCWEESSWPCVPVGCGGR